MSDQRRRRQLETKTTQSGLSEPSAKQALLKTCQAMFSKDLTEEETAFWANLLQSIEVEALRFAFDNWNRSGRFFPKPAEILELVEAFNLSKRKIEGEFRPCGHCDNGWIYVYTGRTAAGNPIDAEFGGVRRCQCWLDYCELMKQAGKTEISSRVFYDHYGQGYGAEDVRYFFEQFRKKRLQVNRSLNPDEIEVLYVHLDEKRKEVPFFRQKRVEA